MQSGDDTNTDADAGDKMGIGMGDEGGRASSKSVFAFPQFEGGGVTTRRWGDAAERGRIGVCGVATPTGGGVTSARAAEVWVRVLSH